MRIGRWSAILLAIAIVATEGVLFFRGRAGAVRPDRGLAAHGDTPTQAKIAVVASAERGARVTEVISTDSSVDDPSPDGAEPPSPGERQPENMLPARAWKNAGRATPLAAFETLLWAAMGGDLDAVEATLSLEPAGRAKAEEFLARLPPEVRVQAGSIDRAIALFVAQDLPGAGAVQFIGPTRSDAGDEGHWVVRLQDETGTTRNLPLRFRRDAGGWRAVIGPDTIERLMPPANSSRRGP